MIIQCLIIHAAIIKPTILIIISKLRFNALWYVILWTCVTTYSFVLPHAEPVDKLDCIRSLPRLFPAILDPHYGLAVMWWSCIVDLLKMWVALSSVAPKLCAKGSFPLEGGILFKEQKKTWCTVTQQPALFSKYLVNHVQ